MDLDGIEVFVKVLESGSFSRAAKLLGMPNSTVSAKVSALEKRLGVTLLQRTTRKLRATPAGETYFQQCVLALERLKAAESELTSAQREPQGLLRVTAPADIGHSLLATLVRGFLQRYPKAEVELVVTNRVLDLIAEGVDLAMPDLAGTTGRDGEVERLPPGIDQHQEVVVDHRAAVGP